MLCCSTSNYKTVMSCLQIMATIVAYSNMSTESLPKFIGVLCRTVTIEGYCPSSWKVSKCSRISGRTSKKIIISIFVDNEDLTRNSPGPFGFVHDVSDFAGTSLKVRYGFVTRGHILHSYGFVGSNACCKLALSP